MTKLKSNRKYGFIALTLLLGLGLTLGLTNLASAQSRTNLTSAARRSVSAIIDVDSTADNTTADDDLCTLREAIKNANTDSDTTSGDCAAGSGWDTINIPTGTYALTLGGSGEDANATGDLDVLDSVTISGAGSGSTIIDGNAADRVLDVDPTNLGVTLELQDVTLTNGTETDGGGLRQLGRYAYPFFNASEQPLHRHNKRWWWRRPELTLCRRLPAKQPGAQQHGHRRKRRRPVYEIWHAESPQHPGAE